MGELLMIFMFIGILFVTGITFMGFLIAFASLFFIALVMSFLGALVKFIPYVLMAVIVYFLYQKFIATSN
ncbi:envelope stress response protein PspG [Vibrio gallicus]|uniref:envelope stress response protein PspG n=1 Tax=Vibrio gallicus TaxID=190897 RepID=UPI0021C26FF5|nr:envelope stress response protein PspG [Vibrio gallicus]